MPENNTAIAPAAFWPATQTGYLFETTSAGCSIKISFGFDTAAYKTADGYDKEMAAPGLLFYEQLHQSLTTGETKLYFSTTLEATAGHAEVRHEIETAAIVNNFIVPVIGFLQSITVEKEGIDAPAGLEIPLPVFSVSAGINTGDITHLPLLFEVQTVLMVTNTVSNTETVIPLLPQSSGPGQGFNLEVFAQHFENVFENFAGQAKLKLLTCAGDNNIYPQLWAIKTDAEGKNGIKIEALTAGALCFAPARLNHRAQNFETKIGTYQTGKEYPAGVSQPMQFYSVDTTTWAQLAFTCIDDFLTPEYTDPINLLSAKGIVANNYIKRVEAARNTLALLVAESVETVTVSQDNLQAATVEAKQTWAHNLAGNLSAAYTGAIVIQLPVSVTLPESGNNIEGNIEGTITTQAQAFEGSIPLQIGKQNLAFLFTPSPDIVYSPVALSGAEYSVQGIYTGDKMLTASIPFGTTIKFGCSNVPLPCYKFAGDFTLHSQLAEQSLTDSTMPDTYEWEYTFGFVPDIERGDILTIQLYAGSSTAAANTALQPHVNDTPLNALLAQFVYVYPAIIADLEALKTITPETDLQSFSSAEYALKAFASIAGELARGWENTALNDIPSRRVSKPLSEYEIDWKRQEETGYLQMHINTINALPQITMEGYTALPAGPAANTFIFKNSNEKYLLWEQRNNASCTFTVKGFNVLNINSVSPRLYNTRNVLLQTGGIPATNPQLLAQSQSVTFPQFITAIINAPVINLVQLAGQTGLSLLQYLDIFYNKLFKSAQAQQYNVSADAAYSYTLPGTDLETTLPVFIMPAIPVNPTDNELCIYFSETVANWQAQMQPAKEKACYIFKINIFTIDDVPLLNLQLVLPLSAIGSTR